MVNWFEPLQETNQPSLLSSALLERGHDTVSWSPRGPQLQLIFPLQPDGAREGGGELQEEEGGPELLGLGYRAGWTSFAYSGPRATSQGEQRREPQQAGPKSLVAGSHFRQHPKGPCPRVRAHPLTSLNSAPLVVPPRPGSLHSLKLT